MDDLKIKALFNNVTESCKALGIEFVFAVENGVSYSVSTSDSLRKIVDVIEDEENS